MNIKIESIQESDFEQLAQLITEFATFQKTPHMMINTVEKMKDQKDFFKGFAIKDNNNQILGYVTYFFAYYTWVGKSLYMDDLYISPKHRGQGLGSTLIKKVIALAQENKCHRLRWQVSSWNKPAISFYESLGASIDHNEMNCDLVFAD